MSAPDLSQGSPDDTIPPIDPGEAALAVIGISTIIDGDMPRVGVERMREIQHLGKDVQDAARAVAGGQVSKPRVLRPHSYRQLLDRLSRGLTPQEVQDLVQKFPPEASDVSGPFVLAVQQCLDHLKAIFPTSEYVTFTGPRSMTPPDDKVFDFFQRYMFIDKPMSVFPFMSAGALMKSHATAVQQFFPTLSKAITAAMYQAIAREKAAKPQAYQLRIPVSDGFKNWLGQRVADFQPHPPTPVTPQMRPGAPAALKTIAEAQEPQKAPSA